MIRSHSAKAITYLIINYCTDILRAALGQTGRPFNSWILLPHVGVVDVLQLNKGLLDGLRGGPPHDVVGSTRLVVGAGHASAAEGLLANHGARRLVVDVEVASGHLKLLERGLDEVPVGGEHRARQSEPGR